MKLNKADFDNKEYKQVKEVLNTGLLTKGNKVAEFERSFTEKLGVKFATTVASGSIAVELALIAAGIQANDEVIIPCFSCPTTINSLLHIGAKPILVDVNINTLNIDITKIEEKITKKTKAIMPVDLFGIPVDIEKIKVIANSHNLLVIEDARYALGSRFNEKYSGTQGDLGVFSFYASRIITTGEGGMVVTNNPKIADRVNLLRNYGIKFEPNYDFSFEEVGYSCRMTEIQAAIGVAQIEKLDAIAQKRRNLAEEYNRILYNISSISPPIEPKGCYNTYQPYVIKLDVGIDSKKIIHILTEREIACKIPAYSFNLQPIYNLKGSFPVSEYAAKHTLAIPLHTKMDLEYLYNVCDVLAMFLR